MKTKPDRKFMISPGDVEGPLNYNGHSETFTLRLTEYGDEGRADKVVELKLEDCFLYTFARIVEELFEERDKWLAYQEDRTQRTRARIRRAGGGDE